MPFKLSEKTVDSLLHKLGHDDDFRDQFQSDPRAALASLGHEAARTAAADEEGAWTCLATTSLADKDTIRKSHESLRTQLLSAKTAYNPVGLKAE
jgi:putative modified peptide